MKFLWTVLRKIDIIKKNMARPRKLKLGNGEITLSGYTPEEADKIQALLTSEKTEVIETGPQVGDIVNTETMEVLDMTTLTETAVDLLRVGNEFKLVFVKYNANSKSAKVVEVRDAG